jgi:hypothetical protein
MGTLNAIIVPGTPPANATRIPIFPPTLDVDGLASWYAPEDAVVDSSSRVVALTPRLGSLRLVPSAGTSSPLVEQSSNGRKVLHTTIARADKTILEPTPGGSGWPNQGAAGMSFLMPMKMLNVSSTAKGIANLFGLQVRHYSSKLQIQRPYAGGTQNFEVNYDASALSVLGITLDVSNVVSGTATPILKLYQGPTLLGTSTSANWTGLAASTGVIGALTNLGGTPSEAQFGDILMYSVVKTDAQMATISTALGKLFSI